MYVKISVKFKWRQDLENLILEIIVIKIFIKNTKFILLAFYYQPTEGSKHLISNQNKQLEKRPIKEVLLMGDLNVNCVCV